MGKAIISSNCTDYQLIKIGIDIAHKINVLQSLAAQWNELFIDRFVVKSTENFMEEV
jgi:hypothetical protein